MRATHFTAALLLASTAAAQLEITEILADPVGPNNGFQIVEIQNTSGAPFTPTGWTVCAPFRYDSLPSISVPAGGVVRLHIGVNGGPTATDWFMPNFATRPLNPASDTFLIYKSSNFHIDADIVDFVSWGGGSARRTQAENIGEWPAGGVTIPGPFLEGETIAWDGTTGAPVAWYRDASPTLGAANPTSTSLTTGFECATSTGLIGMSIRDAAAVDGNRDFGFTVTGGPVGAPAGIFVGSYTGSIPIFGCSLEVTPFVTLLSSLDPSGTTFIPLSVPFGWGGLTLATQAVALDAAAPNLLFGGSTGEVITFGG